MKKIIKIVQNKNNELNLLIETLKNKKLITDDDLTKTQKKLKNDKK